MSSRTWEQKLLDLFDSLAGGGDGEGGKDLLERKYIRGELDIGIIGTKKNRYFSRWSNFVWRRGRKMAMA